MKVYPAHQKIVIPYRADIENLMGAAAQRFQTGKDFWLAVPHSIDGVRLLRNHGIPAPSPVGYYYDWAGDTPFESQKVTADMPITR